MIPIAAFLAGALLSLLLPVLLLSALVTWYWVFVRRMPGPAEPSQPPTTDPAPSNPGQSAPPTGEG